MTLTIDLPDALASRLNTLLPEDARQRFAIAAIADALLAQEQDSNECMAAVEEAFADMEAGRTNTLEEEQARWQQQKASLLVKGSLSGA